MSKNIYDYSNEKHIFYQTSSQNSNIYKDVPIKEYKTIVEKEKSFKFSELNNSLPNFVRVEKERNFGIDLLRLLAMYMIVILHIINQGGVINNTKKFSFSYYFALLLNIFAYSSVNVYALISGYVMINSKVVQYKIIILWLNIFYYSSIITIMFKYIPYLSKLYKVSNYNMILSIFFPTISKKYWYFTAYFGMYFFIPYINKLIHSLDRKENKFLCIKIIILFTLFHLLAPGNFDPFCLHHGYSLFWLILLYIIGAYLKLYPIQLSWKILLLFYFLSIIFPWILLNKYIYIFASKYNYNSGMFVSYNSPFILLNAIILVTTFSKLEIKNKILQKFIGFLNNLYFNVYLIHTNEIIFTIYKNYFKFLSNKKPLIMNLMILTYSLEISLICLIIDLIRFNIFKALKIHKITNIIKKIINK